jgi:hypothetical protein
MAAAFQPATYPDICFSKAGLSSKTKIKIMEDNVEIFDPVDGYMHTFPGGSSKFDISVIDSGNKKRSYKNITIRRLMPLCPLSGLPISESHTKSNTKSKIDIGLKSRQGFAFNCGQVDFLPHFKFNLQPAYYFEFGNAYVNCKEWGKCEVYLVVPIVDGREIQPSRIDALMDFIGNMDIVDIISAKYKEMSGNEFNFHMASDTPIKVDTLYHKQALVDLFHQGKLQLGITVSNLIGLYGYRGSILILEPKAYNHISPYGKVSYLQHIFPVCQNMIEFKQKLIDSDLMV